MIKTEKNSVLHEIKDRVHSDCIACGFMNTNGLHLDFESDDKGSVEASFECDESFEGYDGILHGGVIATVLDAAMGNCMFAQGKTALTVEMNMKFRRPVFINKPAKVSARIKRSSHPLYLLSAKIIQDGRVRASAEGKFFEPADLSSVLEGKNG